MRVLPSSGQSRMSPGVQLSLVLHLNSTLVLALDSITALSTQLQGTGSSTASSTLCCRRAQAAREGNKGKKDACKLLSLAAPLQLASGCGIGQRVLPLALLPKARGLSQVQGEPNLEGQQSQQRHPALLSVKDRRSHHQGPPHNPCDISYVASRDVYKCWHLGDLAPRQPQQQASIVEIFKREQPGCFR